MGPTNLFPQPNNQPPQGMFLSNTTKFTLCVYWEKKKNGQYYSVPEIQSKMNRKYIDSYDYHLSTGYKSITRHDEAFYKMLVWMYQHMHHALKALIFLNDFLDRKQYLIAKLSPNELQSQLVVPTFTDPEADYMGLQQVYVSGLGGPALDTYDLIQRVLSKKPMSMETIIKQKAA